MKQYIYKVIITLIAVILIYEFTVGKLIKKYTDKIDYFSTKDGRKELIISLKDEIKKGVGKDRYLSKEDAILLNQFIKKIQRELSEAEN